jgi:hypothetical protein
MIDNEVYCQEGNLVLTGKILDKETSKSVASVNITNYTRKRSSFSDSTGYFRLRCKLNDTLLFSAIGYKVTKVIVSDTMIASGHDIKVFLFPKTLELNAVTIYGLGSYSDFKRKVVDLDLKEKELKLGLPTVKPGLPVYLDKNKVKSLGFALNSPISFLYYNLSKEEQSRRRVIELEAEEKDLKLIDKKYNYAMISLWSGLKGEELNEFILFCNFSNEYLIGSNDYEIIKNVKAKYAEFISMKSIKKQEEDNKKLFINPLKEP